KGVFLVSTSPAGSPPETTDKNCSFSESAILKAAERRGALVFDGPETCQYTLSLFSAFSLSARGFLVWSFGGVRNPTYLDFTLSEGQRVLSLIVYGSGRSGKRIASLRFQRAAPNETVPAEIMLAAT